MGEEEIADCIFEVDKLLSELECALESKKYALAYGKLREARAAIDDLREDIEAQECSDVGMDIVQKLK
jgi:hypothetical protein